MRSVRHGCDARKGILNRTPLIFTRVLRDLVAESLLGWFREKKRIGHFRVDAPREI